MEAFKSLHSKTVRLDMRNMDTDQVIPARFLRNPRKGGYAGFLFHDMRFTPDGSKVAAFPLNMPANADARILVAGDNFGCGSSREGAVYALFDAGFRCVIAPSFGDIFRNNCYKNGVLPIMLAASDIDAMLARDPAVQLSIDLVKQTVSNGISTHAFDIEPFWKECLIEGVDDIDLTLRQSEGIAAFAKQHFGHFPWIALERSRVNQTKTS